MSAAGSTRGGQPRFVVPGRPTLAGMRTITTIVVLIAALGGCSNTDDPEPEVSSSTVAQQEVNDFCANVEDAIKRDGSADPEDQAERLQELQEAAQDLGLGVRDDLYAADALTSCEQKLQDAINQPTSPSPSPTS